MYVNCACVIDACARVKKKVINVSKEIYLKDSIDYYRIYI